MFAVIVRAEVPPEMDLSFLRAASKERALLYLETPGLLQKAFVVSEDPRRYGAHYLWLNEQAARSFIQSEQFQQIASRFPHVEIEVCEVVALVDRLGELDDMSVVVSRGQSAVRDGTQPTSRRSGRVESPPATLDRPS